MSERGGNKEREGRKDRETESERDCACECMCQGKLNIVPGRISTVGPGENLGRF